MICVKVDIPQSVCDIDEELKAIYHSKDSDVYGFLRQEGIEIILSKRLLEC